jgi:hypothetical protein
MDNAALAVLLLLSPVFAAAVVWIVRKQKLASRSLSHYALFLGLCRLHGLDKAARKLLARFARHVKCVQPARLFIDPALLDRPAAAGLPAKDTERLQDLREELFTGPPTLDNSRVRPYVKIERRL